MSIASNDIIKYYNRQNIEMAEQKLKEIYGRRYTDYRKQFRLASELKYEPDFPLYLMLEQTYRCNLHCVSCIQGYPNLRKKYDPGTLCMPWNLYTRIIQEAEGHRCPSIAMHCNDEPLLVKDLSKRIAFARKHGFMDIIMTTNGVLFTEDKVKEVIDAGVTRILFSIDAISEKTYKKVRRGGDLDKVLLMLEKAVEYRKNLKTPLPILRASFVPNAINEYELESFLKIFSEIVDYIDIQPFCTYYDANIHLIPKGARQMGRFKCSQPWARLVVRANGDVLPCCSFYGTKLVIGNLYNKTLKKIFNSDSLRLMRDDFKRGYYRSEPCRACSRSVYEFKSDNLHKTK